MKIIDINEEWYDAYRDYKGMGYSDAEARAEADRAFPQSKAEPKPQRKPELIAMHFFNVPSDDEDTARMIGLKQSKSGKWYVGEYTTSKPSNVQAKLKAASDTFGEPKRWEPKKKADEAKKSPAGGPACWKGKKIHPTKPTKMKGGKRVNNCIDAGTNEDVELAEGPLVLSSDSSLLRMLDTLLSDWKRKQHSDEEMEALLKALGYSMDKKGDRTVLVKENELEEAPGAIRKGLAAVALIAGLWGVNNQMAQQAYDASPQLQKLTAYLEVAKEHNDQRMIDQLEARIEAHKFRIDVGKGEVMGKDGMPVDVVYDKESGK